MDFAGQRKATTNIGPRIVSAEPVDTPERIPVLDLNERIEPSPPRLTFVTPTWRHNDNNTNNNNSNNDDEDEWKYWITPRVYPRGDMTVSRARYKRDTRVIKPITNSSDYVSTLDSTSGRTHTYRVPVTARGGSRLRFCGRGIRPLLTTKSL